MTMSDARGEVIDGRLQIKYVYMDLQVQRDNLTILWGSLNTQCERIRRKVLWVEMGRGN